MTLWSPSPWAVTQLKLAAFRRRAAVSTRNPHQVEDVFVLILLVVVAAGFVPDRRLDRSVLVFDDNTKKRRSSHYLV